MSSMKNLEDTDNFGDQFLYDKPTKDDQEKSNVVDESDSTIPDPIYQTVTSTPPVIAPIIDFSSPKPSEPESGHSEHSSDDVSKQDEGHVSDLEDTDNAHIPKVTAATWFKPIPEDERPATPEPEWTIPPNDFPEPENNWANAYATTYQVPAENKLQRKTYDIAFNLVKAFHKNIVFLQFQMDECHKLLTNKVDLVNPEGHQILRNIYEPLPLGGPPGQLKAARYLDFGLEELVLSLWVESERDYDISAAYEDYTIVPKLRAVIYRDRNDQRKLMRLNEIHKFSDGTLTRVMEKLDHMVHQLPSLRLLEPKRTIESRAKRSSINLIRTHIQFFCLSYTVETRLSPKIKGAGRWNTAKPTLNKLLVGDLCDSTENQLEGRNKIVGATGKQRDGAFYVKSNLFQDESDESFKDGDGNGGASFTQGTVSSIPFVGSISPEGFLPPILLLVVIIVTVVVTVVVVVVVGGVPSILKLSFMVIGSCILNPKSKP
ncbi:hypothetical protein Tco_1113365 [Tanacetum coccineum]|uniref:Uncharacterized protein n=1 Tax=Tanacetum coccineum TaxID=301880 RepID=A0ABQ5IRY0_9ASTR